MPLLTPEPGPATLKTRRWGGNRLATLRHASAAIERPIGESWEFSTLADSESRSDGMPLRARLGRELPFLAKLIDTALPLSIQVHPDDDDAAGRLGKEEAWIILDADPGAVLWAGVREGIDANTFADVVRRVVASPERQPELISLLRAIPVRSGSVFVVPAGTVHAIGAGILLAEIQQPTDCTFRLFDYGSGRPLQVDDALAATRVDALPQIWHEGQAPRRLAGKHVELTILGPGRHARRASTDELIVAVAGACIARLPAAVVAIPEGGLRLLTAGGDYELEVPTAGQVVVGTVHPHGGVAG